MADISFGLANVSFSRDEKNSASSPQRPSSATKQFSGLSSNVHETTGTPPPPLVGASTTACGDKVYVFGGRRVSKTRSQMTQTLYELDLLQRHWRRLETLGTPPSSRYFHSMCALGDSKLVCYGGMAAAEQDEPHASAQGTVVMSDVHIYDTSTRMWTHIQAANPPHGRYAHCTAILPSTGVFTSGTAASSALHHNPPSANPNQGSLGVEIDGTGGAEMVVVGGQDASNNYIEQCSIFNLRSLTWGKSTMLGKSLGTYRSVVAPLNTLDVSSLGSKSSEESALEREDFEEDYEADSGPSTLIYSNFNFLDVKLELQVRCADGSFVEKQMHGEETPPGLRFPTGGVIHDHLVISGTFLTSSKQEFAIWALNLRTLMWTRIDTGPGGISTNGSWNRGVIWTRRNCLVVLGDYRRNLAEDYNQRRLNFKNVCVVELEAYGLYQNPLRANDAEASALSVSIPLRHPKSDPAAGGRTLMPGALDLGRIAFGSREISDMELLTLGGVRIPVNAQFLARRWGPYFSQLLQESIAYQESEGRDGQGIAGGRRSRMSNITMTPSEYLGSSTRGGNASQQGQQVVQPINHRASMLSITTDITANHPLAPGVRPRVLYMPHTDLTVRALLHYLYTSSLPPPGSQLCTPQILCSLLQMARPYRIEGLLEATVERLHELLDKRNTAAVFNAAAMAAGSGESILPSSKLQARRQDSSKSNTAGEGASANRRRTWQRAEPDPEASGTDTSTTDMSDTDGGFEDDGEEIWAGELSAVVGLQKRGLKGLMEGRKLRANTDVESNGAGPAPR